MDSNSKKHKFQVIEWDMLEKSLFFPLASLGTFFPQVFLHPMNLVRVRLVTQQNDQHYKSTLHCIKSIWKNEGWSGFYNGFWVRSYYIFSGILYAATYEGVRFKLKDANSNISDSFRSFIAGGSASVVTQTINLPGDIVSQHLMCINNKHRTGGFLSPIKLTTNEMKNPLTRFFGVVKNIYQKHGLLGFYHSYYTTILYFFPNSCLWWLFYHKYCDLTNQAFYYISEDLASHVPRICVQMISAPLCGITTALIMNPLDCIRTRMQINKTSLLQSISILYNEDGWRFIKKGLTAKLASSTIYALIVVFSYEQIKYHSLKQDYKHCITI